MNNMTKNRDEIIIRTSIVGIVANVFLATFKAVVGLLAHSIAVVLDAVNNLSDALSSIITIVGTKLAGKAPDREHPLGHGRAEYLSAMLVSAIILYAGLTSLIESVKKIIHPEKPDYSIVSLIIIGVAIAVKIVLGAYVKSQGHKVGSQALVASGADASFDAILSTSVFLCAVLFMVTGISLEAYVGAIIALVILKAGYEMMLETVDDILGRRADKETTLEIKRLLNEEPEVRGAYDLMLNNYGPNRNYASVHIELNDTMTVEELDVLTRRLEKKVYKAMGIILTGIGVYAYNTKDDEAAHMRNNIQKVVLSYDWAIQSHGFYVNFEEKTIRFDVVLSFDIEPTEGIRIICEDIKKMYPDYELEIKPDVDLTD